MKPEKKEIALKIMDQAVKDLAEKCDAEMLSKVQKLMIKQFDTNAKTNGFWGGVVYNDYKFHQDNYTDYKKTVEALGLTKMHKTVELPNNAATKGMIDQVSYMVKVEEA